MGILNVTPDSFSDGGNLSQLDSVVATAGHMLDQGEARAVSQTERQTASIPESSNDSYSVNDGVEHGDGD